jgi:hypothetical protein
MACQQETIEKWSCWWTRPGRGTKYTESHARVPFCPSQTPNEMGRNMGHCGEKPATNHLSYGIGTVCHYIINAVTVMRHVERHAHLFRNLLMLL